MPSKYNKIKIEAARRVYDAVRDNPAGPVLVIAAVGLLAWAASVCWADVRVPRRMLTVLALALLDINQHLHAALPTQSLSPS
uniref:Uncharacterized protein n=1 Tax=Mycobacterium riyadhense TaxID=486698 RepID=A0A653EYE6_9MYCO|nr:hypothetical protein BIN_B_04575 [Mycobacterium riyadhense]